MTRSIRLLLLAAALVAPAAAAAPGGGPTLRAVSTTTVGGSPSSLTTAAGDVWVSLGVDGVARLDRETGAVVARVEPGGAVIGLAAGFGAVWAIDVFGDRLLRIDPETNTVTERDPGRRAAERRRCRPRLGVGAEPARLDRLPGRPHYRPCDEHDPLLPGRALAGRNPRHADGCLGGHGGRERRQPDRPRDVQRPPGDPGSRRPLARLRGGALWVGRAHATSLVRIEAGRIEHVAVAGLRTDGYGPRLAGGAELWLARTGSVVQVRPHAGRPLRLPQLRHVSAVIVAADHIWVADQTAGRVVRFRNGRSQ